ncbi:uncharacterized protein LOC131664069 [Phymastichus coffea]|uniref:uncharacterized protein LOC131664069 n=1 Tax=Phymastichus coffea TaxID=108790 RepID=UPI00273AE22A|nr:uncharacterized protein LOC131664069 [Phymastichus coffea]
MTIYCIVCKKEPIPGDKSRSFHKFPDDTVLKQQWLTAIGKFSKTKHTKLCSDHFDNNAFVRSSGYTQKRRLLPTAVPCKLVNRNKVVVDSENISSKVIAKDHTQFNSENEFCTKSDNVDETDLFSPSHNDVSKKIKNAFVENEQQFCKPASHLPVPVDLDIETAFSNEKSVTETTEDLSSHRSLEYTDKTNMSPNKRMCFSKHSKVNSSFANNEVESNHAALKRNQSSFIDVSNIPPTKKVRFYDGSQPLHLSRQDFISHEAWTRFLKFYISKNRQLESCRKKDARKNRSIGNIKELVMKLQKGNSNQRIKNTMSDINDVIVDESNEKDKNTIKRDERKKRVSAKIKIKKMKSFNVDYYLQSNFNLTEHDYSKKDS